MLFECLIADDDFGAASASGLPEPAASFRAMLSDQSYAAGLLDAMTERFAVDPVPTTPIQTIAFEVKTGGVSGQVGRAGSVAAPFADIEEQNQ